MSDEKQSNGGCIKALFLLILFGMILGVMCFFAFMYWADKTASETRDTIVEMFDRYRPQTVNKQFFEFRDLEVKGNDGNILEVVTGEQSVLLENQRGAKVGGWQIPGVNSTAKINVPATFRYHIDLNGKWEVQTDDSNRLHVVAPKLKPSLPVAFDSTRLQKDDGGLLSLVTGSGLSELEKQITPHLESTAKNPEHIASFKDEAKKSVAKFLQNWLVKDGLWKEGRVEQIIVYFPGEEVNMDDKLIIPNMSLDQRVF